MKDPIISIIVPVYNSELYIRKCIESILEQTFKDFELIIVNDGSTDSSETIIEDYAAKDSRIKTVHKKNGGVSSARNAGLRISKGDFISFVDGDDWILKDMYFHLYKLIKESNSDIAICSNLREINGEVSYRVEEEFIKEMDNLEGKKQLFTGRYYRFAVWGKLYKKSCFVSIEYPEDRFLDDLPTTYKVFSKAKKVSYTNYAGYVYVLRENSIITSKYNEKNLDVFLGWDEIINFMDKNYSQLSSEYISCFVYYSLDHVYRILNQVNNQQVKTVYLLYIQQYVRRYYKTILVNNSLSLKYKYLVILLICNVKLFSINNKLKRTIL